MGVFETVIFALTIGYHTPVRYDANVCLSEVGVTTPVGILGEVLVIQHGGIVPIGYPAILKVGPNWRQKEVLFKEHMVRRQIFSTRENDALENQLPYPLMWST